MKKTLLSFLLVMVSVSFTLVGCNSGNDNTNSEWKNEFKKAQKIDVVSPDSFDVIMSISEDAEIENFIESLKIDNWDLADIPSDANKGIIFKMYQEVGAAGDGGLEEVATMTTFKDTPHIEFSFKGFSFGFKVPEEVVDYLNSYSESGENS
ncbi:hypothetical protein MUN88_06710 [Gracilibacillus caseinilyticus]|uniref:Lipoprotein n=1 Tax=Gracilibacillus caseinilyticus TaxID=2932256 RepID=A0ABY4EZE0_9BACI|nr:hypothetical protein [Gracilibacillus caseinilyticus]UOQ49764.1 hypothetical protein MUN88_06710 [Gracilibacillus caseinilyticus]